MHLVHSAIRLTNNKPSTDDNIQAQATNEIAIRYKAYKTACNKYSQEIAAIQRYLPGWMPGFR